MAAILAVLYAWLPYATGYGSAPVTILHFASTLWKGEDWQHCYLVPLAIGAMVYFKRRELRLEEMKGSLLGLAGVVLGLGIYAIGFRADNVYIGYASFQVLTGGLLLWFFGWKWMTHLFFAWAFLVFLYPLAFLDNFVAFPLRMVMSETSVGVLNFIGIPAVKVGTAILSAPDAMAGMKTGEAFSVDVADPCSGIRSLFALMMVSALYGYFTQRGWWRKIVLFMSSAPLAVLGNLARILMLTVGTIMMGPEVAIGTLENPTFFHMLAGYLVFAVALAGLLGIGWLLNADWRGMVTNLKKQMPEKHPKNTQRGTRGVLPSAHQDEY